MLVGYNTNVQYKDKIYHVQTEDNGINNPVIVTFLYYQGAIIASKKTNYADILNEPDYKEKVAKIMKAQHKYMIRELLSGRLTLEGDAFKEETNIELNNIDRVEEKNKKQQKSIVSMDETLLNFILKRMKK